MMLANFLYSINSTHTITKCLEAQRSYSSYGHSFKLGVSSLSFNNITFITAHAISNITLIPIVTNAITLVPMHDSFACGMITIHWRSKQVHAL